MSTNCLLICLLINNCNISFSGISRSLGPLAYLDGEIIVKRFIYGTQVNTKSETIPHSDVKFISCETGRSSIKVAMPHSKVGYVSKWTVQKLKPLLPFNFNFWMVKLNFLTVHFDT